MSLESYSWLEATFFFKHSGTQARKSCANLQALLELTDYGHTMANFLILCGPNSNPTQSQYLGFGCKVLVFCRNDG